MFFIRGRRLWKARKPLQKYRSNWKLPMTVIVHHAADHGPGQNTIASEKRYLRAIQNFHMGPSRRWSDIAYNYLVMPSGRVWEGRGFGVVGAHAPDWNTRGIGVCFAGNGERGLSEKQIAAYNNLINRLKRKGANIVDIKAHGDVYPTSCPGTGIRRDLGL